MSAVIRSRACLKFVVYLKTACTDQYCSHLHLLPFFHFPFLWVCCSSNPQEQWWTVNLLSFGTVTVATGIVVTESGCSYCWTSALLQIQAQTPPPPNSVHHHITAAVIMWIQVKSTDGDVIIRVIYWGRNTVWRKNHQRGIEAILWFKWRRKASHSYSFTLSPHLSYYRQEDQQLETLNPVGMRPAPPTSTLSTLNDVFWPWFPHRAKLISTPINAELKSCFKCLTEAVNNMQWITLEVCACFFFHHMLSLSLSL